MERRYLAGREIELRHVFEDGDGALTPATVTVTLTRDGDLVAAASGPAARDGDEFAFAAGPLLEGVYRVEWVGESPTVVDAETIEVVGGFLFTVRQARHADSELTPERFPAAKIEEQRDVLEWEFERISGRSFTPRTMYVRRSDLPGSTVLLPVLDVRSVDVLDANGDPLGGASLERIGPFCYLNLGAAESDVAGYRIAYGMTHAPEDVRRAGYIRLRWLLMAERSGIPDRATSYQPAEGGTYTLATPGRGGYETGIPDVDTPVKGYRLALAESVIVA